MTRYTKRPVTIHAMQWDGSAESATQIIDWALAEGGTIRYDDNPPTLHGLACRCDGRGVVPKYGGKGLTQQVEPCPETEPTGGGEPWLSIDTIEGVMRAAPRDFVIRGVKGEFYSCRADIFYETYSLADDDGTMPGLATLTPTSGQGPLSEADSSPDPLTLKLYATDDAMVWAEEWCKTAAKILDDHDPGATSQLIDAGWMVGWFANAMEIAKSHERERMMEKITRVLR